MNREEVHSDAAPMPGGAYSQGIEAGGYLFTAGFGPVEPRTQAVPATVAEQTRQVLDNIAAVLAARGLTLEDVVKATVHLQHLQRDFDEFDAVYRTFFQAPYPVRTTVGSDLKGILVEIDVVASVGG